MALGALVVIQYSIINLFANGCACHTASSSANQTSENGSGNTAQRNAEWAAGNSQCCTKLCTFNGTSDSTGSPTNDANSSAGFLAKIFC
ncbi:hypothetical protein ABMA08_07630 [Pseudomonas yamanorum]